MRPLRDMTIIQIEVTNACWLRCTNCTRFVGHHRKPFYMTQEYFRSAIESLEGFPGRIGMMGGEPTLHPEFIELCEIMREMIPDKRKREFWTSGHKWDELKDVILETFDSDRIAYNDHTSLKGQHHPLLIAADDVIEDKELMWKLIDNCWIQEQWSASITPKGAFFCEVAAAKDMLVNGPGGWPLEKNWWQREPVDFREQMEVACTKCSAAIPLDGQSDLRGGRDGKPMEFISKSNKVLLEISKSPRLLKGEFYEYAKNYSVEDAAELSEDWNPSHFRPYIAHNPEDVKKGRELTEK